MIRFSDAVRQLRSLEEASLTIYGVYSELTEHPGLKRMLSVLIEAAENHLKELSEILENTPDLDSAADPEKLEVLDLADLELEYSFDASIEYIAFLEVVMQREETITTLHDRLAAVTTDESISLCLRRCAEDGRKHLWIAKNRYDLETM